MKKTVCLALAFLLLMPFFHASADAGADIATECYSADLFDPLPAEAATVAPIGGNLEIKARSCLLMEPETRTVLYESNSSERLAPASITKIMPLLLIMEAIDSGKIALDTVITASEYACSMGGSQIWLEPGEQMTLDDMLKAIVIASDNDATVAEGETLAGSEENFVRMMNDRATELGMTGTTFVNCTGLDAEGHLTTAYDVAVMSCELLKHDLITKYSTVWMDTLRGDKSELVNTNKLVRFYEGCIGLKTGTTSQAGSCLSAAARRDGMTLVAVVMGGENSNARFDGARKMLNFGFANYSVTPIDGGDEAAFSLPVKGGDVRSVECSVKDSVSALTLKGTPEIVRRLELPDSLSAPVQKGQTVGKMHIFVDGEELGTLDITADTEAKKRTFWMMLGWLMRGLIQI